MHTHLPSWIAERQVAVATIAADATPLAQIRRARLPIPRRDLTKHAIGLRGRLARARDPVAAKPFETGAP
jgi:hypothetical protein